jgi:hypothetical protein
MQCQLNSSILPRTALGPSRGRRLDPVEILDSLLSLAYRSLVAPSAALGRHIAIQPYRLRLNPANHLAFAASLLYSPSEG